MRSISIERVKELLSYDATTGLFTWRVSVANHVKSGHLAGGLDTVSNYHRITLDGVCIRSHRIAWVFISGDWPKNFIDHINGDRSDNRAVNLRNATRSQNAQNMKMHLDKKVLFKGVTPYLRKRGGYLAQIVINGKQHKIGIFDTAIEAHLAYKFEAEKNFGAYAKTDCKNLGVLQS